MEPIVDIQTSKNALRLIGGTDPKFRVNTVLSRVKNQKVRERYEKRAMIIVLRLLEEPVQGYQEGARKAQHLKLTTLQ